jgi:hypothetical protein
MKTPSLSFGAAARSRDASTAPVTQSSGHSLELVRRHLVVLDLVDGERQFCLDPLDLFHCVVGRLRVAPDEQTAKYFRVREPRENNEFDEDVNRFTLTTYLEALTTPVLRRLSVDSRRRRALDL